jgi:hypothetical protein
MTMRSIRFGCLLVATLQVAAMVAAQESSPLALGMF